MRRFSLALVALALVVSTSLAGCGQQEAPVRLEQEGALVVDGAQLQYLVAGTGAPIVILHGGPGIGVGYLLAELDAPGFPPEGLKWVAYDQRGSGRSTGAEDPSKLTMDRFVEDLEAIRAATGQERVTLMGHSFGGLLALHYALRYPDRVAAMILIDPEPASRALWAEHEDIVESRLTEENRMIMQSISTSENWQLDPIQLENYHLARFQAFFGKREASVRLQLGLPQGVYGNFPATAVAMRENLGDWDLFDSLGRLDTRTLIVTGDQSVFPSHAHERLGDALPRSELVVLAGVGHFPHMEDKAGFAEAVSRFLNSVTADAVPGA